MSENDVATSEDFDLDNLLTMDSESIESDSEYKPDLPYIQVDRNEFLRVLKLMNSFPAKSTVLFAIGCEGDDLLVYATNQDAVCSCKLKILNDNHYVMKKPMFLDLNKLMTFVSAYTRFMFAFDEIDEDHTSIFYVNATANLRLETYSLDFESTKIALEEPEQLYDFPMNSSVIKAFITGFDCSFKITDNKLLLTKQNAEAFFTLYKMNYNVPSELPEDEKIVIRRNDLPSIKPIVDYNCKIGITKERNFFYFDLGMISFLRIPYDQKQFNYPDTFATGEEVGNLELDIKLLRQATKLSASLASGIVEFSTDNSKVYMGTDSGKFYVGSGTLEEPFSLSLEIFGKLVSVFDPADVFVKLNVKTNGVEMVIGQDSVYSLSRTSVNTQKRKEKIDTKIANRVERKASLAEKGKLVENTAEHMPEGKSMMDLFSDDEQEIGGK